MSVATQFLKDPSSKLDYGFDWSLWLETGDTISTVVWTVPAGLTKESEENSSTVTKVWLSGGTLSTLYTVSGKITTSQGRIDERSFTVFIVNR